MQFFVIQVCIFHFFNQKGHLLVHEQSTSYHFNIFRSELQLHCGATKIAFINMDNVLPRGFEIIRHNLPIDNNFRKEPSMGWAIPHGYMQQ